MNAPMQTADLAGCGKLFSLKHVRSTHIYKWENWFLTQWNGFIVTHAIVLYDITMREK